MTQNVNYYDTSASRRFHLDNNFVRLLFGPVGCGKSVACCMEIFARASLQAPGYDGIRRTRWGIVRNTYPELKSTTIKTWQEWYPAEIFGSIKWSSPITHHIRLADIDCEVIFLALDSEQDIKKLRSFEFTGIYINEMQFIPLSIFNECRKRVNRYPAAKDGAYITWSGVIADANPPDTDHWIYRVFEEQKPDGYSIHKYDPALVVTNEKDELGICSVNGTYYKLNEEADYLRVQNDRNYWVKIISGSTDEEIKVNLLGQYGIVIFGKPVHPTYNDQFHYSSIPLIANDKLKLGLGWDFGMTPSCIIVQQSVHGQLQVLAELCSEDMGLRDFANNIVIPYLNQNYPFWQQSYHSSHDPAGNSSSQTDGNNCQEILKELGIISFPAADNNNPTPRRDALSYFLSKMVSGEPAFKLSSNCKILRKGLMGQYQYARIKVAGDEKYHEKPLKNMYSHPCEALEYICMHYSSAVRKPPDNREHVARKVASGFNRLNDLREKAYGIRK